MKYQKKVVIGDCTLYLANCLDIVHHLPRDTAIVADPPYGVPILVNFDLQRKGQIKKEGRASAGKKFKEVIGNDEEFDPTPFLHGPKDENEVHSLGGFKEVILWGANHFAHKLPHNGRWLVWDKRCGVIPERSQADGEVAWHNEYGALRIIRHIWDGMVKDSERGEKRVHPTQKPVHVMRECLKYIKGQVICDPYMGSGTTGVACVKEKRAFIGVELDPEYFDASCKRIESAYNEPDLLTRDMPAPVQDSFFPAEIKEKKPRKKKA